MTRAQFTAKAVRAAEQRIYVPRGWLGTYRDVTNGKVRVRFSGGVWVLSRTGHIVSKHDSRAFAIGKARRLSK